MSAIIGICAARTIWPSAAVESVSGQETRIRSAPASSQRRIWSIVATASLVGVLVIVCTLIGAPPPTDRKSVVQGQSVSVRVELGGRRNIKKKQNKRRIARHP